jgi:isopenicillin N synthase-like dioxygenase
MPGAALTLGTTGHSDCSFLTVLLQDAVGGLQVLMNPEDDSDDPR